MQYEDATERLIAEQAVLAYRAVVRAAEEAPWGRGLEMTEHAVLEQGREQQKRILAAALAAQADAQKRSGCSGVSGATSRRGTSG